MRPYTSIYRPVHVEQIPLTAPLCTRKLTLEVGRVMGGRSRQRRQRIRPHLGIRGRDRRAGRAGVAQDGDDGVLVVVENGDAALIGESRNHLDER